MPKVRHCEHCDGSGKIYDDLANASDCPTCDGTGHIMQLDEVPPPPDGPGGQTGQ